MNTYSSPTKKETKSNSISQPMYILGLHIGASRSQSAIVKVSGEAVSIEGQIFNENQGKKRNEIIDIVKQQASLALQSTGLDKDKIIGTSISTPGPLDSGTKFIYTPPNVPWARVDIQDEFGGELPNPIYIDNDADASALAELYFGKGKNVENFICLQVCTGIGAGIIVDKKIYRGFEGMAGEVGHQTINFEGEECRCGNKGCLEVYVSGWSLVEKMKNHIKNGLETILIPKVDALNYLDICEAAEKGDPLSINLLTDAGKYLGIGIANMLNGIGPERLIITGQLSRAYQFFEKPIRKEVQKRAFPLLQQMMTTLEATDFGEAMDLVAAAATFVHQHNNM